MVMIWDEQNRELSGYNGAGRAAGGFSLDAMKDALADLGETYIPMRGPLSVTVPGAAQGCESKNVGLAGCECWYSGLRG